ncbi:MAG: 50S ribosomal protein L17 [Candidatus Yanofskybacteria bacterium]|nr:50S ribosomal protein L17 [Candidatus Yanofskybacteria bacterium]
MKRGKNRKFGRVKNQRKALYKALATALIENGKIKTTAAKAKSLSQFADKLVTQAKKGNLASRKLVGYDLGDKAIKKLMNDIGPKFKDKKGGYTKVLRLGRRISDGAEMAIIEFTS